MKSDVYGFGVVLLEILTGLAALDPNRPSGEHNLVDWKRPCLSSKKKLKTIIDPKLGHRYSLTAAFNMCRLILKCLESDPKNRPSMQDVLTTLETAYRTPYEPKPRSKTRPLKSSSVQPPSPFSIR